MKKGLQALVVIIFCLIMMSMGLFFGDCSERDLYLENKKSSIIQEDENFIYVCGGYQVRKIDKVTGETTVLWENYETKNSDAQEWKQKFVFENGSGLLLGDYLYFIELYEVEIWNEGAALSVIRTDGSGYQRIENLTDYFLSYNDKILLQDGIMYLGETLSSEQDAEDYGKIFRHYVYTDGTISERLNVEEDSFTITNVFPAEKGWELVAYNNEKLLFIVRENDYYKFYLMNSQNNKSKLLCEMPVSTWRNVIDMDEKNLYFCDYGKTISYKKVSLETGKEEVLFEQEIKEIGYLSAYSLMDPMIHNGYLYYMEERDYAYYLMRRSLDNPSKEEFIGDVVYDTGIGAVGELVDFEEKYYSIAVPEEVVAGVDLQWLKVDECYQGAKKINQYLKDCQNENITYEKQCAEELNSDLDFFDHAYSFTSYLEKIAYFDGRYISFYQIEELYTGGAHGGLFLIGYVFDLQTGERLELKDIIENSEDEMKQIVESYFEKLIQKNPDYYWDDSMEYIHKNLNMDAAFYLTEDGIRFYLPTYAISSYAMGCPEVTVPYGEFEMKIILEGANHG